MAIGTFDVNYSGRLASVSPSLSAGTIVVAAIDGSGYVPATAANVAVVSVIAGITLTDATASGGVQIQQAGVIGAEVSGLGVGSKSSVIADPVTARCVRKATPVTGDLVVGVANERGDVSLQQGSGGAGTTGARGYGFPASATFTYSLVGDGTTPNRTALLAAATALGSSGELYFEPGVYYVEDNTTLVFNVRLGVNAKFKVASGKTLTFNGQVIASDYQDIFSGSPGLFVLNANSRLSWCWWGADPTGTADSHGAVQASIQACLSVFRGGSLYPPASYGPAGLFYVTVPPVIAGTSVSFEGAGTLATVITVKNRQHPALVVTQKIGGLTTQASLTGGAGNSYDMSYVGPNSSDPLSPDYGIVGDGTVNYLIPSHETSALYNTNLQALNKLSVSFFYQTPVGVSVPTTGCAITANGGQRADAGDTLNTKNGWSIGLSAAGKLSVNFNPTSGGFLVGEHPTVLTPGQLYYVELNWDGVLTNRANFHVCPVTAGVAGTLVSMGSSGPTGHIIADIYSMTSIGASKVNFPDDGAGLTGFGRMSNLMIRNDYGGGLNPTVPVADRTFDANTMYGTNFEKAGPNGELLKGYSFGNDDAHATYSPIRLGDREIGNNYGGAITIKNLSTDNGIYAQLTVHLTVENVWVNGGTYGLFLNNNCYESKVANCNIGVTLLMGIAVVSGGVITIADCNIRCSGFATVCYASGATWTSIYAQSGYVGLLINSPAAGATVNLNSFYSTDEAFQTHNATVVIGGDANILANNCVFESVGSHGNVYIGVYDPSVTYATGNVVRTSPDGTSCYVAQSSSTGVTPTDTSKWKLLVNDLIQITSGQSRLTAIACAWNDIPMVPARVRFVSQTPIVDGAVRVVGAAKSGGISDPTYASPWHNSTNSRAVIADVDDKSWNAGRVAIRNKSGVATVFGSGGGANKSVTVTFRNAEDDAYYIVPALTCGVHSGSPSAASMGGAYWSAKTTTGFTANLQSDPGAGNAVDIAWSVDRWALLNPPTLTSLSPTHASGSGTAVTLTGTGYVDGAVITINGVAQTTTFSSSTSLSFVTPTPSVAGDHLVYVTNPDGRKSGVLAFHFDGAPVISSVAPTTLTTAGGTAVITGNSFLAGATCTLNGVSCTVGTITSTTVNITVPSITPHGTYNFVVSNPGPVTSNSFAYVLTDPVGNGTAYGVSGLKHWLKSDVGVTVAGARIDVVDQSGAGNTYSNYIGGSLASTAPTVVTGGAGINSRDTFSVTKASTQALIGPSLSALTAGDVFLVLKPTVDGTSNSVIGCGAADQIEFYPFSSGAIYSEVGSTTRQTTGVTPPTAAQIVEFISTSSEWTMSINGGTTAGVDHYTTATNAVGWATGGTFLGGCNSLHTNTSPNNYGTALIGEFLVFDHKLSGTDRTAVMTGLRTRWGTP